MTTQQTESKVKSLIAHPAWKKLLLSAEASLGESYSFNEPPEPATIATLLTDYQGEEEVLFNALLDLIEAAAKDGERPSPAWAVLKEGATVLLYLNSKGYGEWADWERANGVLWRALENFMQGSWSKYAETAVNTQLPRAWKEEKFVYDALLITSLQITEGKDNGRLELFFNSSISKYWKSFNLYWSELWGPQYHKAYENYYGSDGYRNNHKLIAYELLAFRLANGDKEFPNHPDKRDEALNYLRDFPERIPAKVYVRQLLYSALMDYYSGNGKNGISEEGLASICTILSKDDVYKFLLHDSSIAPTERGRLLLELGGDKVGTDQKSYLAERWSSSKREQRILLPDLLAAVKHDQRSVQEEAIAFLRNYDTELFKYLRYVLSKEYEQTGVVSEKKKLLFTSVDLVKRYARIYKEDIVEKLLEINAFTQQETGRLLLYTPNSLEVRWDENTAPNHDVLLPYILAAVNHKDAAVGRMASAFLKRKSSALQDKLNALIDELDEEDKAGELMASAIQFGNDITLKAILQKCVVWVASDRNGTLVDRAAAKARYLPGAVVVLLNLLNNRQHLSKQVEIQEYVLYSTLKEQQNPALSRVFKAKQKKLADNQKQANGKKKKAELLEAEEDHLIKQLDKHTVAELYNWCYAMRGRSKSYQDLIDSSIDSIGTRNTLNAKGVYHLAKAILDLLLHEKMIEREITVQKWITEILGEMSDRWYFEDMEEEYAQIKAQLERLAIEPLSKRLPEEENIDIRENLVKILGNIGGRVAVDALVRTVTGEERKQAARQELLSEYYLKPSKARSEEASILLKDAVESAKRTMRLLQLLNLATFALGVILILGGITIATVSEELGGRVVGFLAGIGGLTAILTQFLKDPLERIQRAVANLVQVQTAFTSFIWKLNLNGTYIQSQYVAEGTLTDFDLRQTVGRIDHAMERTIEMVQVYSTGKSAAELAKELAPLAEEAVKDTKEAVTTTDEEAPPAPKAD